MFEQICTENAQWICGRFGLFMHSFFLIFSFSRIPVQTEGLSWFQAQACTIIWKQSCYQSGYLKLEFKVKNNNLVVSCKQKVYFRDRLPNCKYRIFVAFFMTASDCYLERKIVDLEKRITDIWGWANQTVDSNL